MGDAERIKEAASLPWLSPSAPYEMRDKAIKRVEANRQFSPSMKWWEVYPEGHVAALAFHVWQILGINQGGWEVKDHELPEITDRAG